MTSANPQSVAQEYKKPGAIDTFTVGATPVTNPSVNGQVSAQLVEYSADRTVIPAQAGSLVVAGVAMHEGDAAGIFKKISVATEGVWPLKASGVITAGARLKAGATGTVVVAGATPDASAVIGIAQEAIASGSIGRVKLIGLG